MSNMSGVCTGTFILINQFDSSNALDLHTDISAYKIRRRRRERVMSAHINKY